ncbi:MAG: hypothetical protein QNK37_06145 [Acidobacteriota bacterium]|nr:hypothetical protein [Acidobacteriota bacterium]
MKALAVLRYLARIPAALLALLVLTFAVGERLDVTVLTAKESLLMSFMFVMWIGLILGWLRENLGGILVLAGFAAFYITEWVTRGSVPFSWVFMLFPVCGLLYLLSWWMHHLSRHTATAT